MVIQGGLCAQRARVAHLNSLCFQLAPTGDGAYSCARWATMGLQFASLPLNDAAPRTGHAFSEP
eukprot:8941373-Alexandrium_andersonii.AAC.2